MTSLFNDIVADAPRTQSIKYAGSKLKLLPHILKLVGRNGAKSVLGWIFRLYTRVAGSGENGVSRRFKRCVGLE